MSDHEHGIRVQKQELRKTIRARLRDITDTDLAHQSQQVWQQLWMLPCYQNAQHVGLFLSMPHQEIQTRAALQQAMVHGKTIYVPEVGANFEKADMELIQVLLPSSSKQHSDELFYDAWPRNKWQIPEPPASMPRHAATQLDLIIVPGLAFDRDGGRCGQGKGYYDHYLRRIMSSSLSTLSPTLVGVGLSCQLVEHVPTHDTDMPLDMVIVPDGIFGRADGVS